MKKIFTLMAAAVMALAANAKDFTDKLVVNLLGNESVTPEAVVTVEEVADAEGTYNLTLKDFKYETLALGDITVNGVKGNTDADGFVNFEETKTTLNIQLGTLPITADVTLSPVSRMKGDKLYMSLAIKAMGMDIAAVFGDNEFPQPELPAYTFTDDLTVTVDGFGSTGTMPTQKATIAVQEQEDGKYTLSLKNFELEGYMPVGTIEMKDVEGVEEDGKITLSTKQTVTIIAGDDPDVEWALEGVPVEVEMTGTMTEDKLIADIAIVYDMMGTGMPEFIMNIDVAFGYIPTGINNVTTTTENKVEAIYDLSGKKLNEMQKGVIIVRMSDGTTVKVLKK